MKLYKDQPTTCQIGPARAAYPSVFKARRDKKDDGSPGDPKYSVTLLIPKKSHAHMPDPDAEVAAIRKIVATAVSDKWGSNPPKGLFNPLKDGDAEGPEGQEPKHPGYWYVKAATNAEWPDGEPKNLVVCDGRGVPIANGFVGGDWCKAKVLFKAFENPKKKGVTCYLSGVQWLYKDEPFGSSADTSTDEFDKVEGAAGPPSEYDPFQDE